MYKALDYYAAREAREPYVPPEPAFRLFPPERMAELRALVAVKREERAAALKEAYAAGVGEEALSLAASPDQISQRKYARELDRSFRQHGRISREAPAVQPSADGRTDRRSSQRSFFDPQPDLVPGSVAAALASLRMRRRVERLSSSSQGPQPSGEDPSSDRSVIPTEPPS